MGTNLVNSKLIVKRSVVAQKTFSGFPAGKTLLNKYFYPEAIRSINLSSDVIPPGTIWYCASSVVIPGWLPGDGAAYSRSLYKKLFESIGTTYGAGDGINTFNVPDPKRHALGNLGLAWGILGQKLGSENASLSVLQIPSHNHPGGSHSHGYTRHTGWSGAHIFWTNGQASVSFTSSIQTNDLTMTMLNADDGADNYASSQAHNNVQAGLAVRILIKY